MRSRREAVSGAWAKYSFLLRFGCRVQAPTHILPVADSSELGYGLLNFIRFKFTTDQPISHLAIVRVSICFIFIRKYPLLLIHYFFQVGRVP